jgi:hypothetical protein
MLRANYARELVSWAFLPVMLGAVEGGTVSIVVKKHFAAAEDVPTSTLNLAVAAVTAAPAMANVTSFLWAGLAHGRAKVPFIAALQVATAIAVGSLAMAPCDAAGLWFFTAAVIVARVCWTGVITIRTGVWRANYPHADRTIGLAGNAIYRRVRLRGQRRLARAERSGRREDRASLNPLAVLRVLREDPPFRRFMRWMFIFGLGNLMLSAPLAIVLEERLEASYIEGILVAAVIPLAMMPLIIPLWARLLGRLHVVQFRSIHGWSFVAASGAMFAADLARSFPLFCVASAFLGIGFAGGVLAWNLGHHDYAPEHRDGQYMGVHVTLTGLRGIAAPFLAVGLYGWLDSIGFGSGIFLVCLITNVVGLAGFISMARDLSRRRAAAAASGLPPPTK